MTTYRPNNKPVKRLYEPIILSNGLPTPEIFKIWTDNKNKLLKKKILTKKDQKLLKIYNKKLKMLKGHISKYSKLTDPTQNILKGIGSGKQYKLNFIRKEDDWSVKTPGKRFYIGVQNINSEWNNNSLNKNLSDNKFSSVPQMLSFLINPESLSFGYAKQVTTTPVRGSYKRPGLPINSGNVVQHFWDELDTLSGSGTTGNFMVAPDNGKKGGLIYPKGSKNSDEKKDSLAHQQFMKIVSLVKNNGCTWVDQSNLTNMFQNSKYSSHLTSDDFGVVYSVGDMFIYYDQTFYWGNFESFDYTESGESPFGFTFNFSFKVSRIEDSRYESGIYGDYK